MQETGCRGGVGGERRVSYSVARYLYSYAFVNLCCTNCAFEDASFGVELRFGVRVCGQRCRWGERALPAGAIRRAGSSTALSSRKPNRLPFICTYRCIDVYQHIIGIFENGSTAAAAAPLP